MNIHQAERRDQRGHRVLAVAGLAVAGVLAAAWVGLFSFLGVNSAFGTVEDIEDQYIPDVRPLELDLPDLSRLSRVFTADNVLLGTLTERNSQPIPLEEIPELVINAILAAEDADFFEHEGIDFRAIVRAAVEDIRGGARQGGSTITQQVVKQNFGGNELTLERKAAEAVTAAELERRYTKEEILEFYMNSVFFGANAYGVKAAAQEYYGKELDELTIAEAAAMMTPIRNPSLYDLRRNPEVVQRARDAVIINMVTEGFITEAAGAAAQAEPVATIPHAAFEQLAPQIIIAVNEEILNNPAQYNLGDTFTQAKRAIFGCPAYDAECAGGGGLEVYVTLDFDLQVQAQDLLRSWFPLGDGPRPTGAIATIENETGAIRVMAGGLEFGEDIEAGQRPYDLAGKGRQNPGSAFKPIGLATALENGIPLNSYWDWTSPQILDFPGSPRPWSCSNFSRSGEGIRTLESALVASTNTVFCQLSLAVGAEKIVDMAHRLGVDSPLNPVPSIVIGSQAVSPLELTAAFSTFANYGSKRSAYLIERIVDDEGNIVYQHEVEPEQVIDRALAAAVVNTMQQVVQRGTGQRANIGRPQAGKTGTHQNITDVWFVGYIPQYTTGVWVGHADAQIPLRNVVINGQPFSSASSSRIPAPLWKEFMEVVLEKYDVPVVDFPEDPEGTAAYYAVPRTDVPDVVGLVSLKEIKSLIYKAGLNVAIDEVFDAEIEEGTVISQVPEAGAKVSQGGTVTITVSQGPAPEAPAPNLIGRTLVEADAIIFGSWQAQYGGININWNRVSRPVADPAQYDLIVDQSPAPGALVKEGENVFILYVGVPIPAGG